MKKEKSDQLIVKSNELIEASYKLTAGEQRIILTLASVIKPEDEEFKKYRFKITDFAKMLKIKNNRIYKDVKTATKDLMRKVFTIKKENSTLQIAWLSSVEYIEGEGIVELEFSPKLKPYLLQLKSRFTSYKFQNIIQLKSSYSFRIYELLKQYQKIGKRVFTIDELKYILGIDENIYSLYADFKRYVILKAQKEINTKTDISFDFEQIKTGRKVTALKFILTSNKSQNSSTATLEKDKYIDKVKSIFDEDISSLEVEKIYKAAGGNIELIKEKYSLSRKSKKIDNLAAWVIKALKEDYKAPVSKEKVDPFNDFDQREYNFKDLEKQLLGLE